MNRRLSQLAESVGGVVNGDDAEFSGVSIDTRTLQPGELFVALNGEHADGHEYVRRAATLGATGALVERLTDPSYPQVQVADSLAALQHYASDWRAGLRLPVVGVTGSNGKTTVKEMLASILGKLGDTLATQGNFNNHIGVPLTLLRLDASHDYAVVEMGASHAGEIALLTRMARPDVGVITNAGTAHLEGFGSREGVARAKGELFADLASDGTAIINADDVYAPLWQELSGDRKRLLFGLDNTADVTARALEPDGTRTRFRLVTPRSEAAVELPLAGRHNVMNALAAAAAASALAVPAAAIAAGLAGVSPVSGRLRARQAASGAHIIDDSYNANPGSLKAALSVLSTQPGELWLVLGDMAELGQTAGQAHAEAGRAARIAGVRRLYAVGELSKQAVCAFGEGGRHFDDQHDLIATLQSCLTPQVTLLVKGSRSAHMDRVVDALRKPAQLSAAGGA